MLISAKSIIKFLCIVIISSAGLVLGVNAQQHSIAWRVDSVMRLMTLEEKIGQLNQYSGGDATGPVTTRQSNLLKDIRQGRVGSLLNVRGAENTRRVQEVAMQSRLKIPLLFGLDVIHGYKTVFPVPLAEAASWDLQAMQLSAHIAAKEAAAAGIHWTFAPMVDISRDPRWGRVMEGAGEDGYLGSLVAEARVKGFQGKRLGDTDAIMACAKHFAAYGAVVSGRDYNTVDLSEHELWQTYLPPFKAAVDAGVATFMNAFNTLNGIPATGSAYLQRDILKGKWKFNGFVVSDWNSIGEMINWGFAANNADAAQKAITAGNDMDMESRVYINSLAELVKKRKVDRAKLDDAVHRILTKKFELGLFDDPFRFCNNQREQQVLTDTSSKRIARQIARKSIVLLKNDGILPLKNHPKKIAVIGPLMRTKSDLLGSWTINTDTINVMSLYEAIQASVGKETELLYAGGCSIMDSSLNGFEEAVSAARNSDVVIMALGEAANMTGEAASKTDISIPGVQEALFKAVVATGKPVIVVLMSGRPMIFNHIADNAHAILSTFWLGQEAGPAIADVLFGIYNPSGKLPISFPRNMGQIPVYYAHSNTGRPLKEEGKTGYVSAYIDSRNTPRYAFGYGMSYTRFLYSDLQLSQSSMSAKDSIRVSFKLSNAGKYTGEETAQLYVRDKVASVVRPVMELKDFVKISLQPGETRTIKFTINKEKLSFYNSQLNWVAEPGAFEMMIGGSSDDIKLISSFSLLDPVVGKGDR